MPKAPSSRLSSSGKVPEVMPPQTPIPGERSARRRVQQCSCGCSIPEEARFCRMCGKRVEVSPEEHASLIGNASDPEYHRQCLGSDQMSTQLHQVESQAAADAGASNAQERLTGNRSELDLLRKQSANQQQQLQWLQKDKRNLELSNKNLSFGSHVEAGVVEQEKTKLECEALRQQLQVVRKQREQISHQLSGAHDELIFYRQKQVEADAPAIQVAERKDFENYGDGYIVTDPMDADKCMALVRNEILEGLPEDAQEIQGLLSSPFSAEAIKGQAQSKDELIASSGDTLASGDSKFEELVVLMELEHRRKTSRLTAENEALRTDLSSNPRSEVQSTLGGLPAKREQTSVIDLLRPAERAHQKVVANLEAERTALLALKYPNGKKEDELAEPEFPGEETFSDGYKDFMCFILYVAVFFDTLGQTIMIVPAPMLFTSAGCPELAAMMAPMNQESIDEGVGMYKEHAVDLGFATCINAGVSIFAFAAMIAKLSAPYLAKVITKKGCIVLYMFGGAIMFTLNYCAVPKIWDMPWIYYLACRFCTGLVGGSGSIACMLISDYFANDVAKREARIGIMFVSVLGAISGGPVIGKQFIGDPDDPGGTLKPFLPLAFCAAGSVFVGLLVIIFIRELPKPPPPDPSEEAADAAAESMPDEPDKENYVKWVVCVFGARIFDSLGDGAPTYMVSVGLSKFGCQADFAMILVGVAAAGTLAMPALTGIKEVIGWAGACFIGQFLAAALLAACALVPAKKGFSTPLFLLMIMMHYFWTAFAILARTNMVLEIVPRRVKDTWLARVDALDDFATVLSPYCLVKVLDNEKWGPWAATGPESDLQKICEGPTGIPGFAPLGIRPDCGCMGGVGSDTFFDGAYLCANGIMNASSCIFYIFLLGKFPLNPKPVSEYVKPEVTADDEKALELYRNTGITDNLRFDLQWEEFGRQLAEGIKPHSTEFGRFSDDLPQMDKIFEMTHLDLIFYKEVAHYELLADFKERMASKTKRKQLVDEIATLNETNKMNAQQKWDIGRWVCDYLAWAGYGNPCLVPRLWKSMFMTTFPKLCYENGWDSPLFIKDPVPQLESEFQVINGFLDLEKTRQGLTEKANSMAGGVGAKL